MLYTARVQEIAAKVATLEGAGIVHHRLRLVNQWQHFLELFKGDDDRINGWMITRRSGTPSGSPHWSEVYALTKVRGLNDAEATDLGFQEHLDAAVRLFRLEADLSFGWVPEGLRIVEIEPRMFGSVLCHVAECELPVVFNYVDLGE